MKPQIFIITGTVEGGKTVFLKDLAEFISLFDINLFGFISRGHFTESGNKDFILHDLISSEEIHLASRVEISSYFKSGRFYFNPSAVDKGEKIIQKAIDQSSRVLIIDEIGPAELSETVWYEGLINILQNFNGIVVFSTRLRLIEAVMKKFGIIEAFIEDIEITTARKTGESIIGLLKNQKEKLNT